MNVPADADPAQVPANTVATTADASLQRWLAVHAGASARGALSVLDAAIPPPTDPSVVQALLACLLLLEMLRADEEVLLAAILHALPEWRSCLAALEPVARERVQALLDGQRAAEQVWTLHAGRAQHVRAEGLRRLLLALVRDLRVILILLARQLVRMRGAASLPEAERVALAQLSADIHAPLANRLGIWQLKWELEDLAFRHLHPDTYKRIARLLDEKRGDRERFIEDVKARIRNALDDAGVRADVAGRPKHIFSIWKKMQRKDVPFGELYDVRAVRVLVDDIATCYAALGVVHQLWPPVPSEFDDYIANPKGNQYRSLHTAVIGPEGRTLEVQIRTHEMHAHSELGVAAHWRYKEGGGSGAGTAASGFDRKIAWMRQLLDRTEADGDEDALLAGLRTDLVEDRIYLLTPKGEVIDLPRGGTVLDFAYHVHTEVGHRCRGAKVNGRIVPLNFRPNTGDRVEIMTAKTSEPRRDWLMTGQGFLASARSRDKVRAWFHQLDRARTLQDGRELLDRELKRLALHQSDLAPALTKFHLASIDELHVEVALGDVSPSQVARALHDHAQAQLRSEAERALPVRAEAKLRAKPSDRFIVEGVGNLLTQIARCCQPVAGDAIVGYLTRARGVSIHREGCAALQRLLSKSPERLLPVEWGDRGEGSYSVDVQVRGFDRKGLLKDLANLIAQHGVHVLAINSRVDAASGLAELMFTLKVRDFDQLGQLLGRLNAVPGVDDARRLG